ncbi:helix-turn-helix domain-containing protein [Oxalobacter vibrioformis]|uniref:Helix-turn-helix domain-containing protein n=1 Tax=Oxalobacter vibrioformis TaxID=933080 RepID=A0A9E9LTJ5_9BURK|nr:Ada metal-binding domain-containing protein [Oxalobacter vibrioformis]WAW09380.1 helix-turn-helix domain-containing protein [Oxalobacter vibrioformis]
MLTEDEMWSAVQNCDDRFDGVFYYAVVTTGIFCRPSCKSRKPVRGNTLFFVTPEVAAVESYRPCKRCRPDIPGYEPTKIIAEKARKQIDQAFTEPGSLPQLLGKLGVTQDHLALLFKRQYGITLHEYRSRLRVEKAGKMLRETEASVATIVHECGFGSLSSFYSLFKKYTGMTPTAYRIVPGRKKSRE